MGADFQKTQDHEEAFQERVKEHACETRQIDTGTICIQPDGRIFTR